MNSRTASPCILQRHAHMPLGRCEVVLAESEGRPLASPSNIQLGRRPPRVRIQGAYRLADQVELAEWLELALATAMSVLALD